MDIRDTVITPASFFPILLDHYKTNSKVSLLIDKEGITRVEGFIAEIKTSDDVLISTIILTDQTIFQIKDVIAVNGLFKSDYSEC
jgi:hypothetical protein